MKCYPWTYKDKIALVGDSSQYDHCLFYGQVWILVLKDISILNEMMENHGDDWETIFSDIQISRKPNAQCCYLELCL
jgi:kynurenine 3-monooxygenase